MLTQDAKKKLLWGKKAEQTAVRPLYTVSISQCERRLSFRRLGTEGRMYLEDGDRQPLHAVKQALKVHELLNPSSIQSVTTLQDKYDQDV